MELPESLPARLYLLAYDRRRQRLTARPQLGFLLRAAAMADLELGGHVGLLPSAVVTIRDPRQVNRLRNIASRTLHGGLPAARVDPRDVALVALAAAGELPTVLSRAQRREHRQRITRLTERSGSAAPALRKVVQLVKASTAG